MGLCVLTRTQQTGNDYERCDVLVSGVLEVQHETQRFWVILSQNLPLAGNAPWCTVATPSMLDSFTPFRLSARERLRLLARGRVLYKLMPRNVF
jgi:hypothetical protein